MNDGIALVRESDNLVVTIVRSDTPPGWHPPEGCRAVPVSELPADWKYAPHIVDLNDIRILRDEKLKESDWTQLLDNPLTSDQRLLWANYRQALRDLPNDYSGEGAILWPVPPL